MTQVDRNEEEQAAIAAASAIGIDLPGPCVAGVVANRALLADHAAILDRFLAETPDA